MKHILIITFLLFGLHHYAHAQDSSIAAKHINNQRNANGATSKIADSTKRPINRVGVTRIPAPKHKYGQGAQLSSSKVAKADTSICFPLSKDRQYNVYDFLILLQDSRVVTRYKPFFDKHHLKFSGYVWEEVIRNMLADADPEISRYVVLRSEGDKILIKITKFQVMTTFPGYICHIFSNLVRFDDYLRNVDPARMPGY